MPTRSRTTAGLKPGTRPKAITKLSESNSYKKWLIFGDTGAGKTTLGGTSPRNLFLTFEPEGTESAKVAGSSAEQLTIDTRKEFLEVYDYFDLGSGCDDYDWVTVDSTSEMEECFWRDHLRAQHERKPSTRSLYKQALDDYPQVWNQVKAAIDQWNRLPINVLYTAQVLPLELWDDDREEEYTQNLPLLGSLKNGVLARKVCGMVSLVGFLDVKKKKNNDGEIEEWRRLYVSKRRDVMAKNRYGWGPFIDDPTIPALVTAADSALKGEKKQTVRRRRSA
jgi:AAA domain